SSGACSHCQRCSASASGVRVAIRISTGSRKDWRMNAFLVTTVLTVRVLQGQGQGGPWDPAQNATAQLVDERGAVVDRVPLAWAKATATRIRIRGIEHWLVEVDPQPEAGLYSGTT